MAIFQNIPIEIFEKISNYLLLVDLIRIETVSKYFMIFARSTTWDNFTIDKKICDTKNIMRTHKFTSYTFNEPYSIHDINFYSGSVQLKKAYFCSSLTDYENFRLLTALRKLYLVYSDMTDSYFKSFANLTSLTLIECNLVTDDCMKHCLNLKSLHMHYCEKISGTCFKYFSNLRNLDVAGDYIKPKNCKHLTNLEKISIAYYSSEILRHIENPKKIKSLIIYYCLCQISKELFSSFSNLCELKLSGSDITDKILVLLTNLHKLELSTCPNINGTCLKSLSKLTNLKCYNGHTITNENLMTCTNLRKLVMYTHYERPYYSIKILTQLEKLVLQACSRTTDEDLKSLNNCRSLSLEWCYCINGSGLKSLTNLQKLSLRNCTKLILENVLSVPNDCILNIGNCEKMPSCYNRTAESISNMYHSQLKQSPIIIDR